MKIIEADAGYEVLDRLMAKIQKNGYKTTQEMLDDAHKEWWKLRFYPSAAHWQGFS